MLSVHSRGFLKSSFQKQKTSICSLRSSSSTRTSDLNDDQLFNELREWRRKTSEELQLPVYTIFPNKVLHAFVNCKPTSFEEFREIKGVGPRTQRYGDYILEIIQKYPSPDQVEVEAIEHIDPDVWKVSESKKIKGKVKKDLSKISVKKSVKIKSLQSALERIELSELSSEQAQAATAAIRGHNLFISGSAGTGKSYLLAYVIQQLKEQLGDTAVAVTAPTGVAAINIGGQTIHSFAGIGIASGDRESIIKKTVTTSSSYQRWMKTKALVIDEISMLSSELFELLDDIARRVHKNNAPFGGIQVIAVGDFLQLPPVQRGSDRKFCFQSPLWDKCGFRESSGYIFLKEIVRQKDQDFITILNQVRLGRLPSDLSPLLDACIVANKPLPSDGIIPTKLYCINKDVDAENELKLDALPGATVSMDAEDDWFGYVDLSDRRRLSELMEKKIPKKVLLKVGAQVMLLRNRNTALDETGPSGDKQKVLGLVNGSRGIITGFIRSSVGDSMVPTVTFDNGKTIIIGKVEHIISTADKLGSIVRKQVPLRLAWAVTVHKSQGTTLTRAEVMLSNSFDYGQAYVALSRVTSLAGLWLTRPLGANAIRANPEVLEFYSIMDESNHQALIQTEMQSIDSIADDLVDAS